MLRLVLFTLACILSIGYLVPAIAAADWRDNLRYLLAADDGSGRDALLEEVVAAGPSCEEVTGLLLEMYFPCPLSNAGKFILHENVCLDGVSRPWVLHVPDRYDAAVPTPLLVYLHGGVSRAEIADEPLQYARENYINPLADELGMLVIYPFGQLDATWWDDVGMANIRDQLRYTKRCFNVDDDRVFMGGFSDGASAAFCYAMVDPSEYAGFLALNGHMGVGSLDGDLPTYANNMANTPVYAVTTYDDGLYPSARMRPTIEMAIEAGADILYREMQGTHSFDYAEVELPRIARFIKRNHRDPYAPEISWEAATGDYGRCNWLRIDSVTTEDAAPWHTDNNSILIDDRITIGFNNDDTFEGPGILVGNVVDDTAASDIGLAVGDIIVGAGEMEIAGMEGLYEYKQTLSRGSAISLEVLRDGDEVTLAGELPPVENYNLFKRDRPSARVEARYAGNHVELTASRLGSFTVFVHPDMFNLDEAIVITCNGVEVFNGMIESSLAYMLQTYLETSDRKALYVMEIRVEL